jgi:hypothetical protein
VKFDLLDETVELGLWIIYLELCALLQQVLADLYSWRLSRVIRVFLEGSTQYAKLLIFDVVV